MDDTNQPANDIGLEYQFRALIGGGCVLYDRTKGIVIGPVFESVREANEFQNEFMRQDGMSQHPYGLSYEHLTGDGLAYLLQVFREECAALASAPHPSP